MWVHSKKKEFIFKRCFWSIF